MKLIDNLPNHLRDRKDYLLKLKDSIDIPIACIKCRKYGHHVIECRKKVKEKTKKKQDKVDIKPVTLQVGMAMGRGGVEGWDLRPRPAWIFLAPSPPRPA